MSTSEKRMGRRILLWLPLGTVGVLAAFCALVGLVTIFLFGFGYVDYVLHGPKVALSAPSPDGKYVAYVEDGLSIDPPNQSLLVERGDKTRFLRIAKLAEDIDSIKEIHWSPDGGIVVFHSRRYLTAARVSDWRTVRVYLGEEWSRRRPEKLHTTFSSGARGCGWKRSSSRKRTRLLIVSRAMGRCVWFGWGDSDSLRRRLGGW